jgi:MoaA/NifB/PqqE/SkfB family radical SAM enzyme
MKTIDRIKRHLRVTRQNYSHLPTPPFLILFINSICNQKCEHCFYWRNLNRKDDLTRDELFALSDSLGRIENLNLSGGEPFLRPEFGEICRKFIQQNEVRQIYVPTNGSFSDRTVKQVRETLKERSLELFVVEFSLDGMPEFHDHFRGMKNAFARSMETYDALVEVQREDPRLRIHAISTATDTNMDEIRQLTTYLFDRCSAMEHHNLALIRGDRKNPTLKGPKLREYQELYDYVKRLWATREHGRYGSIVEPMLQWAKSVTAERQTQVIPCRAGQLSAVIYSNGDVSFCETHEPLGNLREQNFWEIWGSEKAEKLRASVARKECYCTNEVFLWPSIVFQPQHLAKTMVQAKVWKKTEPLPVEDRVTVDTAGITARLSHHDDPASSLAAASEELGILHGSDGSAG